MFWESIYKTEQRLSQYHVSQVNTKLTPLCIINYLKKNFSHLLASWSYQEITISQQDRC